MTELSFLDTSNRLISRQAGTDEVKKLLSTNTEEVVRTGGFGIPWMLGLFSPTLIRYLMANKAQQQIQVETQTASGVSTALDG